MSRVLPILFNTDMVRAILDGRKTVTRRIMKSKLPYRPGDILYVRETWSEWGGRYVYKAWNEPFPQPRESSVMKWSPSIHMPKKAARIWLKVTDVRVEQLQDITDKEAEREGAQPQNPFHYDVNKWPNKEHFKEIWNSTIKKSDLDYYGWDANPWVWVIEFERCEKPESEE